MAEHIITTATQEDRYVIVSAANDSLLFVLE